jgi:hypothetical protein
MWRGDEIFLIHSRILIPLEIKPRTWEVLLMSFTITTNGLSHPPELERPFL